MTPTCLVDAQKGYAGMPTIGNARSLWFSFHSPGTIGKRVVWRRRGAAQALKHGAVLFDLICDEDAFRFCR